MKTAKYRVEEQRSNANMTEFHWTETFASENGKFTTKVDGKRSHAVSKTGCGYDSLEQAELSEPDVRWYAPSEGSIGWGAKTVKVGICPRPHRPFRIILAD